MENKILFINSCTRPNSRTKELAKHLLNYLEGEITQVDLYKANIGPIESFDLEKRTENIKKAIFLARSLNRQSSLQMQIL